MESEKEKLKDLLIIATKETGEIAECIVKEHMFNHWREELADLVAVSIRPMLQLAGMEFNYACELGLNRKLKKLQGNNLEEKK